MKVLVFTEHVDVSVYWVRTIDALRSTGIEPVFVTLRGREPTHASVSAIGVPAYALGASTSRDYPLAAARLLRILRAHKIDVLHVCEPIPAAIAAFIPRSASKGKRLFDWCGCIRGHADHWIFRLGERQADIVLACSQASASLAAQRGVQPRRIRVAHRGVGEPRQIADDELLSLRKHLGIAPEAALISVVSRLRPEKGIDILLEAVPSVEQSLERQVAIIVAGDGSEAASLRALAKRVSASQVSFVGSHADVAPWFRVADVVVVPSLTEPFGKSALEAIACRRPVIASAVGGLVEFIENGATGTLVPPGDVAALSDALVGVLGAPDRAAQMADAAYRVYRQRFTTEAMVERWCACYSDLLVAE